jgi:hypothetical protein
VVLRHRKFKELFAKTLRPFLIAINIYIYAGQKKMDWAMIAFIYAGDFDQPEVEAFRETKINFI